LKGVARQNQRSRVCSRRKKEGFFVKKILLVFLMIMLVTAVCFAETDLNQPLSNTSLKSEIHRGFLMYNVFAERSLAQNGTQFDYQVPEVINKNILNGRDSEGFYLGVYFSAWIHINDSIKNYVPLYVQYKKYYIEHPDEIDRIKKLDKEVEYGNEKYALKYYNKFRELESQWGISDQRLCEINDVDYDIAKPYFDKWYATTHTN
jgi:hypothetical protein